MQYNFQYFLILISLLLFSCKKEQKGISYLYDENEIYTESIIKESTSFEALKKDVNNGLDTGVYWFKILPEKTSDKKLTIKNAHILKAELYANNKSILPQKNEPYITFDVPKTFKPIYVKVNVEREAYIPIRIEEEKDFLKFKFKKSFTDGVYYGFILMIFILNLFYFFHFKEITFYLYVVGVFFINASIAFTDGTFNYFFSQTNQLKNIELINQYCLAVSGFYFAYRFLELEFYIPKVKHISTILLTLLLPFVIAYLIYNTFIFYVISEILVFGILGMYLFCGFLLYKKSTFAKFFCLAYSIIFLVGLEYYIARNLGVNVTDTNPIYLKLGGVIEMLLISYAIVYRMNTLKKENELMRIAIFRYIQRINHLKKDDVGDIIAVKENDFSKQELELLQAISNNLTNKEISEKMDVSISTVKYHTKKIYTKLEINSRKEIQNNTIVLNN